MNMPMLSSADYDLIARDTAIPGLGTLLDPVAFVQSLSQVLPDMKDARAQIHYLRYKPGANCLARFRLEVDGQTIDGYAKAYGSDAAVKFSKARERITIPTAAGPGRALLEEDAIEVVFFPNDSKLKRLPAVLDDVDRQALLTHLLPDMPQFGDADLVQLAYKPERRFVARLDVDGVPVASLKVYSEREFQQALNNPAQLRSRRVLRLPEQVATSRKHRLILLDWLPGTPLQQIISETPVDLAVVRRVGAALAELHSQAGHGLAEWTPQQTREAVEAATRSIRFTSPPLEALATEIDTRLGELISTEQVEPSAIHGDFYPAQVLAEGDRIAIIDLDNTVRGNPASDLGLFVAHLERNALSPSRPKAPVAIVRDALIEGYATVRPAPSRASIDLHTAAGLVQLAPHHFRNREPNWDQHTAMTLRRALKIIENLPAQIGEVATQPEPVSVLS